MKELQDYIEQLISTQRIKDAEFDRLTYKPNKSLKECADYILDEAFKEASKKQMDKNNCKSVGWSDTTILNLIIHYYQEDDVKPKQLPSNVTTTPPKKIEKPKPTVVAIPQPPKAKKKRAETKCQELSLF